MSNEDYDWIFDFVLQFLESDKFDAAVMDFVDEKCFVFDCEEENKFIYTDIHKEFKEHIEALIASNLGELGITPEIFLESCERGRNGRDINKQVFERMIAMDDFQTFKKIMVKRNVELQLEAMQALSEWAMEGGDDYNLASMASTFNSSSELPDADELRALKEAQLELVGTEDFSSLDDDKVQEILRQSLMEMELMHRREELEQAELEQAVAISLALEDERLRLLYAEAKSSDAVEPTSKASAESKSAASAVVAASSKDADEKRPAEATSKYEGEKGSRSSASANFAAAAASLSEPKTLPAVSLRPLGGSKALPPIGHTALSSLSNDLELKRKAATETLLTSQKQLGEQRKQEDELRNQLSTTDPDETERRARHMREQRDRIIAQKKLEREQRVRKEEEQMSKVADEMVDAVKRVQAVTDSEGKPEPDEVEQKRAAMRNALARRMKLDLIESEEAKLAKMQEDQFADLDRKLRQVEQLRNDNKKREAILAEQMRKQQANIARNVQKSAASLKEEDL